MRTIELLSGSGTARRRHCLHRARSADSTIWLQRARPSRPWEGLRQLVSQLEAIRGSLRVREALEKHRAAAALLLPRSFFPASGPPPCRPELKARLESNLTHNTLVKRPFIAECVETLETLLDGLGIWLLVPDLAELDQETVWLLDKFAQWRPEAFPSATVGFEPQEERTRPDERGIVWGPFQIHLASFIFKLSRLPGARRVEPVDHDIAVAGPESAPPEIDEDTDSHLLRSFEAAREVKEPELCRSMIDLVRRAFAGHAFESSLRWGLAVLDRCPDLEPLDEAELRNLVALSAHNRQFRNAGNEALAPFLQELLARALELETRPDRKSSLGYRLAVMLGRRQSYLEEALEAAYGALESAQDDQLHPVVSTYLAAWALNIGAFVHLRLGQMDRAITDTERGLELIGDLLDRWSRETPEIRSIWERDLLLSWSVLVSNRVALARLDEDMEVAEVWQRRSAALLDDYPEFELYEVSDWLHSYRQFFHYDLALERAERGLELARREHDTLWEYQFLAQVAELSYRLGRVEQAVEACKEAYRFRQQYPNPTVLGSLDFLRADALDRSGRSDAAHAVLRAVLSEDGLSAARRIEAHALAARLAARDGDAPAAEASANAAIDAAVDHGSRDFLLLAATAAGTASRDLGHHEEAREAYGRALEIAATGEPGDPPPPAGDVFEANLGLWQHDSGAREPLLEALRLLPKALGEPRTSWLLASLAAAVKASLDHEPSLLEIPEMTGPLEQLCLAGSQRPDAAEPVRQLQQRLGLD